MTNTNFNLESVIVSTATSEAKASTKSLASTILGIQDLGVEDTKKVLRTAYTKLFKEPKDDESKKKYQDARKKWVKRRIVTAESVIQNESVIEILTSEGTQESRYNELVKYLVKQDVSLITGKKDKQPATDDEVIARFIQAAKSCDKRGILDKALAKLQEIDLEDVELDVAI